ncbi:multidrug ABC transporter permease/ATP-binding protein [Halopseudomonas nanhaiensis]|uniref:multidrug ABC transporter permease/ATP-binding protein n=1 Tax=Halopseudomonas nanhaiensis TaxID=2830842 RepID=UPI00226B7046|nr:multidrug ABC transporter permease/ATP-binding protein [Halopseudomonas nanhaiensis]UAW98444.1 multidrug ABC transporter permease/ATP-binding protein [Halopseudomonas nanhaiensis]
MKLLSLLLRENRLALLGIGVLSLLSALLSVGVIAYINTRLIAGTTDLGEALLGFGVLLLGLLLCATAAQVALHGLGHRFVYRMRRSLVKRVLDTDIERLEQIGGARILASLSTDIRNITIAFVGLPETLYGLALTAAAFAYLAWLSPLLFVTTLGWLTVTFFIGWLLVSRVHRHIQRMRQAEDRLYANYQDVIDGRKELALNRERARRLYEEEFDANASAYRDEIIRADLFHGLSGNWANIMVLGLIGLVFFLAGGLGWATPEVAAVYALTMLFLRTPMVSAVGTLPHLITAQVSLAQLEALELLPHQPRFPELSHIKPDWQVLHLQGLSYRYPAEEGEGFDVGPLDLSLRRGEVVFVIGGNGSGKSTFARLLTGLFRPAGGSIRLDDTLVTPDNWVAYRQLFASVFTDFHLFSRLLGPQGDEADSAEVDDWLNRLHLSRKVRIAEGRLQDLRLSQGQRKRLALLLGLLEHRDIFLLDEWAADQDPLFRRLFYRELLPLFKEAGKTVVAITHDDRYFDQADRILRMDNGRLTELDDAQREQMRQGNLLLM